MEIAVWRPYYFWELFFEIILLFRRRSVLTNDVDIDY